MLTKTPLFHQSLGPCVCLSFSLSLSLWLILWSVGTCAHSPAQTSKTLSRRCTVPSPPREGTWCLCERRKPCAKGFIGLCINQGISASLSLSYFLIVNSGLPGSGPLKDLNTWKVFSYEDILLPVSFQSIILKLLCASTTLWPDFFP